jgi:oxygen-dependent protoporphyrinogen oxidase
MTGRAFVVGAGIAGLTAGFRLQQAGFEVTVLESTDVIGGRMSSITRDGYVLDRGAGSLSTAYTEMMALVDELGIRSELIPYSDEIGFLRDGRVHRLRTHKPLDLVSTRLMSAKSKLLGGRILLDARKVADKLDPNDLSKIIGIDNETVRDYANRRLTPELRDYVLDPLLRFLYGGEPHEFASTELFFLVSKFMGGTMLNARSGVDFLARALADRLDVRFGARVTSVEESPSAVTVSWSAEGAADSSEEADVCVIALTASQMADIYPQLDSERRGIVGALQYIPLWKVALGTDPVPQESATFVQFPGLEVADLTGVILEHNKRLGRSPAGKGLLSAYATPRWCREHADDDDQRVAELTAHMLEKIIPGVEDSVEFANVTRWDPALLIAGPGTWSSLARFHALTPRDSRVQFAGDYVATSITNSALTSGQRAAAILVEQITPAQRASR